MADNKIYWSGLEELDRTPEFERIESQEFPAERPVDAFLSDDRLQRANTGRRDFLKFMGFSVTAATLAACETPVVKSIPYTNKPEEITPGVANYYASTYYDGHDFLNVLVKTREGRPIFVKNNTETGYGRVNARVNASVLGLYDSARLQAPHLNGEATSWSALDAAAAKGMAGSGRKVLLTGTVMSPSMKRAAAALAASAGVEHIQCDPVSYSAVSDAMEVDYGRRAFPSYRFENAEAVVSLNADFLGTWGDTVWYTEQWAKTRRPENGSMSRLHAFESGMSLTGSNADTRTRVKPSEQGRVAAALLREITGQGAAVALDETIMAAVKVAAADLKKAGAKGLVVAGDNDLATQRIASAINRNLGAMGTTMVLHEQPGLHQGDDKAMAQLVADMKAGKVSALIVDGVNPAYHGVDAEGFKAGLAKVGFSVSTALFADETASLCTAMAPTHHWLEGWNDLQIDLNRIELAQPAIQPLYNTRQTTESLMSWAGQPVDAYTFLRQTHNAAYTAEAMNTDQDWNAGVHNGFLAVTALEETDPVFTGADLGSALREVAGRKGGAFELDLYRKVAMGDGQQAGNPMLQETPDPITKTTWDNYVTMSRVDMEAMGLNTYIAQEDPASVVKVTVGGKSIELPAFPQPGQAPGTLGIALGYGRGANNEAIGKAAYQVGEGGDHLADAEGNLVPIGKNAFGLIAATNGTPGRAAYDVSVEATGGTYPLACTQIQHTYMGRDSVVKETTLDGYLAEAGAERGDASWNKTIGLNVHDDINGDGEINALDKKAAGEFDLWHEHAVDGVGHRWGMAIDLTSCIGCSACVTACHIENNVPVVGKDEVRRHRDMHWMRIDRFYASDWNMERGGEEGLGVISTYGKMEEPGANPQTVHMPMMCQHCNHAPCETVCPVAATTHSNEGVNQMTYNRCIGTRYCANNCPFKVRRFNWFHYPGYDKFQNFNPAQDAIQRMVLNPDVVVRSRGVMEKCSLCVQRTQGAKLEAKKAGKPLEDGSVLTACAEACPTQAITFGDLNDTSSEVRSTYDNNRTYHALEEVGIQPNVAYLTKVRNTPKA